MCPCQGNQLSPATPIAQVHQPPKLRTSHLTFAIYSILKDRTEWNRKCLLQGFRLLFQLNLSSPFLQTLRSLPLQVSGRSLFAAPNPCNQKRGTEYDFRCQIFNAPFRYFLIYMSLPQSVECPACAQRRHSSPPSG